MSSDPPAAWRPERPRARDGKSGFGWLLPLVALLVLLRAPFSWTGHLQEDAYIAFRTAFNLADHGVLGFNVGERYAASTSLAYAYFCAAMRWVAGAAAVPVILTVNAAVAALAVTQPSRTFALRGTGAVAFVLALGCSPGALLPAFNGMETAWCLWYLGVLAEHAGPTRIRPGAFGALLGLAPLLRPDAALLAAGAWLARVLQGERDRRTSVCGLVGLGLGLLAVGACNRLHSGTWLPPSIIAKQTAYHPDLSPWIVLERLWEVYCLGPFSPLPPTKYFPSGLLAAASLGLWALLAVVVRRAPTGLPAALRGPFLFLAGAAALFPLALAAPGALFPWYFHPSSFALAAALLVGIQHGLLGASRARWMAAALGLAGANLVLQLALSLSAGRQESGYRTSVGKYLAVTARPGDTLVLEPAGIIPFYSGLTTLDEVGLTSPRVLPYLASRHETWLAEFLRDACPTFTVQRDSFPTPGLDRPLSEDERWFQSHYRVLRRFRYRPEEWARSNVERWLLRHGRHSDYVVYERRDGAACARGPAPR